MIAQLANTKYVLIDEAGQIPALTAIHIIGQLRCLERIMVTGDRFQLGTYAGDTPDALTPDSLLELANESKGVAFNALKHSFRFHPTYTEIIRKTIYKQLAPAVSEEARSKLLKASIKLPHKDYPFILIHCEHEDKKTASGSRTNAGQTKVALNIFRILSKTNIRAEILTLYSA